ncbi:MAG: type II toxin-antitoxin system prevent-host-death family antitoxin [Variovorax sp.]
MHALAIHQAKDQLSALVHAAERGEEVVLTRHGKRVARIVAEPAGAQANESSDDALRAEAMARLNALRSKVKPGPILDWKALRDAGRAY